jgi:hypothetical protein
MNDIDLATIGFAVDGNGALCVRNVSVRLVPDTQFYRLELVLPHGVVVTCHVAKTALKIAPAPELDIDTLIISGGPRRRPW